MALGALRFGKAVFKPLQAAGGVGRAISVACTVFLLACVAAYFWSTRAWPLVNDPALMHYAVFLMQGGMAPYRDIHDINLPGAYAPEWLSMTLASLLHVSDAAMWRVMDWALLGLAALAMLRIARRFSWFAGVAAGALFALYHGRDGVGQAGQRDLVMAVLLLWAVEHLLSGMRVRAAWPLAGFGLCLGAAVALKPLAVVFAVCLLPLLFQKGWRKTLAAAAAGFSLPMLATLAFLLHYHAAGAFWRMVQLDLPYHVSLSRSTVLQLLWASSIPSIQKLLCLFAATGLLAGGWRSSLAALASPVSARKSFTWTLAPERCLLLLGALLGLLCFVAQSKGYPYQRYPFVAFLLLLASLEFAAAVGSKRLLPQVAGVAGLAFLIVFCAPSYLRSAIHAQWPSSVRLTMESAIRRQAGPGGLPSLQGRVQCLDVATGCTDALLALGLREATGTMYDEFLFPEVHLGPHHLLIQPTPDDPVPEALIEGRLAFQKALIGNAPQIFVVTSWLFPEGPGDYRKLALWPWFSDYLRAYKLVEQQDFPRTENGPAGFRIYVRRALQ